MAERTSHQGDMQLIYSPDDEGWYWQQLHGDWPCSQLFATEAEAKAARDESMLEWKRKQSYQTSWSMYR